MIILRFIKSVIKWTVLGLAFILVLPFGLLARLAHVVGKSPIIYSLFAQLWAPFPGFIGNSLRVSFYMQALKEAHPDLVIAYGSFVSKPDTRIGRRVAIGAYTTIGLADIGDHATIASHVSIISGRYQHNFQDTSRSIHDGNDTVTRVTLGEHSFIGEQSTIMASVGEYSIVGAGSVVVKEIPEYSVALGNPARVVKSRPRGDGAQ